MIGTLSCHGLNVKCPGIRHRCLNISSEVGWAFWKVLEPLGRCGSLRPGLQSLLPKICVCVLFLPPASRSLQPQTGIAPVASPPPPPRCPPLSHHEPNTLISFKWLCLISHHQTQPLRQHRSPGQLLASSFCTFICLCCLSSSHQILVPPFTIGHHS